MSTPQFFALAIALIMGRANAAALPGVAPADGVQPVATVAVAAQAGGGAAYEGVVEAVRQTVVAAQVPGAVVALSVSAGDKVRAGQVLMRIDARTAQAATDVATRDFERDKQLFAQKFISRAALDQAEARFKSAQAQSDFHVVKAPYAGVVANVAVVLGDMAMPGKPLVTLYDPTALRVTATLPQSAATSSMREVPDTEIPGAASTAIKPVHMQWMPTVDAASHTLQLRLDLPARTDAVPGMFARVRMPVASTGDARLFVPARSLVRRAELAAVYVVGGDGKPVLRQVRPGRSDGDRIEILSGVVAGERVAIDPQAAARIR